MWMRLTNRLLQAILITAVVYLTMLLDQAEPPGLHRAGAALQMQAEQPPQPQPIILN